MAQNIEDIIVTDKKAREIVKKAQDRREKMLDTAQQERDRIIQEGKEKLEGLKSSLQSENQAYEESLRADNNKELDDKKNALLAKYEIGEADWANEIFNRITKKA